MSVRTVGIGGLVIFALALAAPAGAVSRPPADIVLDRVVEEGQLFALHFDPVGGAVEPLGSRDQINSSFRLVSASCTDCDPDPELCPPVSRTVEVILEATGPVAGGYGVSDLSTIMFDRTAAVTYSADTAQPLSTGAQVTLTITGDVVNCDHWFKIFFNMCFNPPASDNEEAGCPQGCLQILQAAPGSPDGVYFVDDDGSLGPNPPFQAYCDMTTDDGGWTLIHKTDRTSTLDRNDAGFNLSALTSPAVDAVAILPRATINRLGRTFRTISTDGKRFYWMNVDYYATDNHSGTPFPDAVKKISWAAPWEDADDYQSTSHGICVANPVPFSSAFEHVCVARWCCGGSNAGLWFNGGTYPAGYYAGTGWVR